MQTIINWTRNQPSTHLTSLMQIIIIMSIINDDMKTYISSLISFVVVVVVLS